MLGNYNNEIEQFIYEICYQPMWEAAYLYIQNHPMALDLTYSKIKYPDTATLEDMVLEFPANINTDEDTLFFEAVVSCTIVLTEDTYKGQKSVDLSQWLIVSCQAVVTDRLNDFTINSIRNYAPGSIPRNEGQAASKNIVPVIYKNDFEDEATRFLERYCPEALKTPMPVPIEVIAETLGLEIVQGHRLTDVWHCNTRWHNDFTCTTPVVKQENIEQAFVDAFNSLLERKSEIAANYKKCLDAITDDTKYRVRIAEVDSECDKLGDEVSGLLATLSKHPDERQEITKKHTECIDRYNALQEEKRELNKQIALCAAKCIQVQGFLAELRKHKKALTEFDPLVWQATVYEMVINHDMTVLFRFRDGTELPWTIETGIKQYKKRKGTDSE